MKHDPKRALVMSFNWPPGDVNLAMKTAIEN